MKLIDLRNPKNIEVLWNKQWSAQYPQDIQIAIKDDGAVYVTATESGIAKIKFTYSATEDMQDAYVYGDTWERGYGDLKWSREKREMPWYCIFTDLQSTCGYGVKVQPNALCYWEFTGETLSVIFDIRCGTRELSLKGKTLFVATLVSEGYEGDVAKAAHAFCKKMSDTCRTPKYPIYGGNDWYCCYGLNSEEKILNHTKRIAECAPEGENRPYMVIDSGWQIHADGFNTAAGGPWEPNENFPDMAALAQKIKDMGVIPGIWMRPLYMIEDSDIPKEYIFRKYGVGAVWDPSHPEVRKLIYQDIKKLADWGYRLIKHDFSTVDMFGYWGFQVKDGEVFDKEIEYFDKEKTTAQIIKGLYETIREAAGDDVAIIGCNTVSHLAAGLVELQRTGDDTSGREWERTTKMGVNTLAMRMMQHDAFYQVDADCVGITTMIPWETNRQWLDVLAKSGTPLFVSIGEDAYSEEVKRDLKDAFLKASKKHNTSVPMDFTENCKPAKWSSDFGIDEYDWK